MKIKAVLPRRVSGCVEKLKRLNLFWVGLPTKAASILETLIVQVTTLLVQLITADCKPFGLTLNESPLRHTSQPIVSVLHLPIREAARHEGVPAIRD